MSNEYYLSPVTGQRIPWDEVPKEEPLLNGKPCQCIVCRPKPAEDKPSRLSEVELRIALANQRPNPAKSSIMPMSRFRDFYGRTNTKKFMESGGR